MGKKATTQHVVDPAQLSVLPPVAKAPAVPAIRQIIVDVSLMTIGDIALLEEFRDAAARRKKGQDAQMPMGRLIAFMDRIVEGGISDLPATQLGPVMERVSEAVNGMMTQAQGSDDPEKN